MHSDQHYMELAIELAKKGAGFVNPNPLVGAVIVKNHEIIGSGYHEKYGQAHAEINAFKSCITSPAGATMYVTLEPCSHYGKTPPCVDSVIKHKIARVVIANLDPNPLVAGKSVAKLQEAGIDVTVGILSNEASEMNEVFFHYITKNTPFVNMKYAMTIDGKIATTTGASKWITNEKSREKVHQDRNLYKGIIVGVGTIIADDPSLDCRLNNGRNPIRIICDTTLKTPLSSKVVQTASHIPTIIATSNEDLSAHLPFLDLGVDVMIIPKKGNHIDLVELMIKLGKRQIDGILLEGGATLNATFLENKLVNKVQTYIAPKIFGGANAPGPVSGKGALLPKDAVLLKNQKITILDGDVLIESYLK